MTTTAKSVRAVHPSKMRAAQLAQPGEIRLVSIDAPRPRAGEVLVRVQASGVCGSNLAPWAGAPWFEYPFAPGAPGHEGVGVVEEIEADVPGVNRGSRVAFLSHNAFAEYDVAPADSVLPLPEDPAAADFLGEPLACAMNVFHRSGVKPGDRVAILGVGFLGALLVQLCQSAGASVVTMDRREFARDLAASFGATSLDFGQHATSAAIEANRGALFDVVIEATGKAEPLDLAGELTRERGRLVIAGYHQDGPRQINMQLWNWRGLDVINAHERDPAVYLRGMRDALGAVLAGRLKVTPLITHRLPLDRLADGLDLAKERPAGFLKAVVHP